MTSVVPLSAALPPDLAAPTVPERSAKAAKAFESLLIGSLLESFERTFSVLPGESQTPGAEDYRYLATHALSEAIVVRGGFGIAKMISHDLSVHEGK
jgi:hypothetical protein